MLGLSEAKSAAETFLGHYRRYASVAAKRRSVQPRRAHSKYEKLSASLTEADAAFHAAVTALAAAETKLAELASERAVVDARIRALENSPRWTTRASWRTRAKRPIGSPGSLRRANATRSPPQRA
ncbi:FIG100068: Hypothetical protein [Alloactinosynnema sp. L-07]|uniref:hypothetical protein n=1 Tax=Alloactinosynnema sp. L-07 TaxID=1653480 RepID=UPI00065F0752|nr:hypothetical protein [Alloactinosynnema sp. L-07]CRK54970.1 FIG100068: Hypothetical protein [Alloactinosynnema sp. L-07]